MARNIAILTTSCSGLVEGAVSRSTQIRGQSRDLADSCKGYVLIVAAVAARTDLVNPHAVSLLQVPSLACEDSNSKGEDGTSQAHRGTLAFCQDSASNLDRTLPESTGTTRERPVSAVSAMLLNLLHNSCTGMGNPCGSCPTSGARNRSEDGHMIDPPSSQDGLDRPRGRILTLPDMKSSPPPPPSSADLHDCFWVRTWTAHHIVEFPHWQ